MVVVLCFVKEQRRIGAPLREGDGTHQRADLAIARRLMLSWAHWGPPGVCKGGVVVYARAGWWCVVGEALGSSIGVKRCGAQFSDNHAKKCAKETSASVRRIKSGSRCTQS